MAFVESAAKDFVGKGMKSSASSVCAYWNDTPGREAVLDEQERFDSVNSLKFPIRLPESCTVGTTIETTLSIWVPSRFAV
jgi:hypothetical protein